MGQVGPGKALGPTPHPPGAGTTYHLACILDMETLLQVCTLGPEQEHVALHEVPVGEVAAGLWVVLEGQALALLHAQA